jgi:hypothetical protein
MLAGWQGGRPVIVRGDGQLHVLDTEADPHQHVEIGRIPAGRGPRDPEVRALRDLARNRLQDRLDAAASAVRR